MRTEADKLNNYFNRTVEHIHRVHKNMLFVVTKCDDFKFSSAGELFSLGDIETKRQLMYAVFKHDRSKFSHRQFLPYVELTEFYHQRKVLGNKDYFYPTSTLVDQIDTAVADHYLQENHHPERAQGQAFKMPYTELVEVCCDLQAMAQEFNEGSCRGYFENVWCKKQSMHFSDDFDWEITKDFMSGIIRLFEQQLQGER